MEMTIMIMLDLNMIWFMHSLAIDQQLVDSTLFLPVFQ
jgi:hypothetical protein